MLETNNHEAKGPELSLAAEIRQSGLTPESARHDLDAIDQQFAAACRYRGSQDKAEVAKQARSSEAAGQITGFHQREADRLRSLTVVDDRLARRLKGRGDEDSMRSAGHIEEGWAGGNALWENLCRLRGARYHGLADIYRSRADRLRYVSEYGLAGLDSGAPDQSEADASRAPDASGGFVGSLEDHRRSALEQDNNYLSQWELWQAERLAESGSQADDGYRGLIDACRQRSNHYYQLAEQNPDDGEYYEELAAENNWWADHWYLWSSVAPKGGEPDQIWQQHNQRLVDETRQLIEKYDYQAQLYEIQARQAQAMPIDAHSEPQIGVEDRLQLAKDELTRHHHRSTRQQIFAYRGREQVCRNQSLDKSGEAERHRTRAEALHALALEDEERANQYELRSDQPAPDQDYRDWLQSTVDSLQETVDFCRGQIDAGRGPDRMQQVLASHQADLERLLPAQDFDGGVDPDVWAAYCRASAENSRQLAEENRAGSAESQKMARSCQGEASNLQRLADESRQAAESLQQLMDTDDWSPDDATALRFWLELKERLAVASRQAAAWHESRAQEWQPESAGSDSQGSIDWGSRAAYWADPTQLPQAA